MSSEIPAIKPQSLTSFQTNPQVYPNSEQIDEPPEQPQNQKQNLLLIPEALSSSSS